MGQNHDRPDLIVTFSTSTSSLPFRLDRSPTFLGFLFLLLRRPNEDRIWSLSDLVWIGERCRGHMETSIRRSITYSKSSWLVIRRSGNLSSLLDFQGTNSVSIPRQRSVSNSRRGPSSSITRTSKPRFGTQLVKKGIFFFLLPTTCHLD